MQTEEQQIQSLTAKIISAEIMTTPNYWQYISSVEGQEIIHLKLWAVFTKVE
tara:strand:- start:2162 stop:2317 length:156 start_codon:yes stop_codon:yes gene_type:complete